MWIAQNYGTTECEVAASRFMESTHLHGLAWMEEIRQEALRRMSPGYPLVIDHVQTEGYLKYYTTTMTARCTRWRQLMLAAVNYTVFLELISRLYRDVDP